MAKLGFQFDPNAHDPALMSRQFPVSPKEGWLVAIVNSEAKPTNDGQNGKLVWTLRGLEGEVNGFEGDWNLNIWHKNPQTVDIAYKLITAVSYCVGVFQPFDDDAILMNRPFRIVVGLQKKKKEDDPDYTEIKGVKDQNGNDPGKANTGAAPTQNKPVVPPPAPSGPVTNVPPPGGFPPPAPAPAAPPAPPAANNPPPLVYTGLNAQGYPDGYAPVGVGQAPGAATNDVPPWQRNQQQ